MTFHKPIIQTTEVWNNALYCLMRNMLLSGDTPDAFKGNVEKYPLPPAGYFLLCEIESLSPEQADLKRRQLSNFQRSIDHSVRLVRQILAGYLAGRSEVTGYIVEHRRTFKDACTGDLEHRAQRPQALPIDVAALKVHEKWLDLLKLDQLLKRYRASQESCDDAELRTLVFRLDQAIDWLLGAIDVLDKSHERVAQARARLTPIFRLHDDILAIIFELLAEVEVPTRKRLGWFKLTHVCSAWSRVLSGMHRLWARDAYVYGSGTAMNGPLRRAQGALISVSATRCHTLLNIDTPMFDYERFVVFRRRICFASLFSMAKTEMLLDLNVSCRDELPAEHYGPDVVDLSDTSDSSLDMLERILGNWTQHHLRSVGVKLTWPDETLPADRMLRAMAPHPSLRLIEFTNTLIPFALPKLVSMRLICSHQKEGARMPQAWLDAMLNSLEASPALKDLRIVRYILPSPSTPRRITLPRLESLSGTDARMFELFELPVLQRVHMLGVFGDAISSLRMTLTALFESYGLSLRTMYLSQRLGRCPDAQAFILRFGWHSSASSPPSAPFPLNFDKFMLDEPGDCISLAFPLPEHYGARVLSQMFALFSRIVRGIPGTDAIETIGFDNETREHTFIRQNGFVDPSAQGTVYSMLLPIFPAVRTVELPLRDSDTLLHCIFSLTTDENTANLPLLSCLRFSGSLCLAHVFGGVREALGTLFRVRATMGGISPITSLEFILFAEDPSAPLGIAKEETEFLRQALKESLYAGLEGRASVTFQHNIDEDRSASEMTLAKHRLLATIMYHH
ncbi:hypothetical protein PENSPDRAFT_755596 [Peniophora sp. CONT]|nr:hypothetical protein PENSPDRAFT_755596 [Peniophora sp. CONT]